MKIVQGRDKRHSGSALKRLNIGTIPERARRSPLEETDYRSAAGVGTGFQDYGGRRDCRSRACRDAQRSRCIRRCRYEAQNVAEHIRGAIAAIRDYAEVIGGVRLKAAERLGQVYRCCTVRISLHIGPRPECGRRSVLEPGSQRCAAGSDLSVQRRRVRRD